MKLPVRLPVLLGIALLGLLLSLADSPVLSSAKAASSPPVRPSLSVRLEKLAFGRSGMLRVATANPDQPLTLHVSLDGVDPAEVLYRWIPLHGTRSMLPITEFPFANGVVAPSEPGIWRLRLRAGSIREEIRDLTVVVRVPLAAKQDGQINGYRIGRYATEGIDRYDAYSPPTGFIEVTPENQDMQISEHLRLRQFVTKNQYGIWPKYLALDLRLIDKLELVMQELNTMGIPSRRMAVMSGFRTPDYNGPGEGGRAKLSRHTYGDAADVWVDNDGNGYIDDLNGDGHIDANDAAVMRIAADRVEARYPELIGGNGVYTSTPEHGPFIHIDVRGKRARW